MKRSDREPEIRSETRSLPRLQRVLIASSLTISGIDPQTWLTDVLTRLVNLWPNNRLDELLPWTWAEAHRPQQRAA